jgi:REP element-mobilizing transposase RayT
LATPLRIEYEGAFYHFTARGNERKRIFSGKRDYDKLWSWGRATKVIDIVSESFERTL